MYRFFSVPVVLFASLLLLSACVYDRPSPAAGPLARDVIVVVGEGEVLGKPDVARLQLGVEARASDAGAAVDAINTKAGKMIEVLKQMGIAAEDLQTRDFNIHSERIDEPIPVEEPLAAAPLDTSRAVKSGPTAEVRPAPEPPARQPVRTAYVYNASNTVYVTVRDLSKLGDVLSRAVEAGANRAWGISFEIDEDDSLVREARAQAVQDARARARQLAKLADVRLGRVLSIADAEFGGGGPTPPPMPGRFAMAEMKSVPTESGQLAVRHQVQVVFEIDPPK